MLPPLPCPYRWGAAHNFSPVFQPLDAFEYRLEALYNFILYNAELERRWLGLGSRTATGFWWPDGCALKVRGREKMRIKEPYPYFFMGNILWKGCLL